MRGNQAESGNNREYLPNGQWFAVCHVCGKLTTASDDQQIIAARSSHFFWHPKCKGRVTIGNELNAYNAYARSTPKVGLNEFMYM